MALSKPIMQALSFYFSQLYEHPVRTSAISCATVTFTSNLTFQKLAGIKPLDLRSSLAFGLFGFIVSGVSHNTFINFLEWIAPEEASFSVIKKLFFERIIYFPIYQSAALYFISRFEGRSHESALAETKSLAKPLIIDSWKYLTLLQFLNVSFIPPTLRIFIHYFIGFFWTMYFANARRKYQQQNKSV